MRVLRYLMAAAVVLLPAPAQAAPAGPLTMPLSFVNGTGETLRGVVYTPPDAAGPLPGMVLLHGSGVGPHRTLEVEARAFAAQGIAVLAYDKRRVGYSDTHRDYAALAADAVDAVAALRAVPGVDRAHVGIWGISEGGWVAPLAAARSPEISFVVAASAPALSPMRTENWNTRNKIRAAGVRGPLVRSLSDLPLRLFENAGTFAEARHDPRPAWGAVKQPVLAVYGSEDVQVPPAESAEVFLATVGGALSVRVIRGAGHLLKRDGQAYPGYPDVVGAWVRAVASGTPPAPVVDLLPAQRTRSVDVPPLAWWERWQFQVAALVLLVLVPATYPLWTLVRRVRGRRVPGSAGPRALAALLPLTALAALVYLYVVLTGSDFRGIYPGPILAGRPVWWLAIQALALSTVVAAGATAVAMRRRPEGRLGVLLGGAALFVPWACYWGLLLP